jgi:transposase
MLHDTIGYIKVIYLFFENLVIMHLHGQSSKGFRLRMIVKLSKEGKSQTFIAKMVDCSQAWVSKVLKRYRQEGIEDLKVKAYAGGVKSRLNQEQLFALSTHLELGAKTHGFETDNWTRERIASFIEKQFSVRYDPSHISKIMVKIGFTLQKPKSKSYRKDEQAVAEWKNSQLIDLKKSKR